MAKLSGKTLAVIGGAGGIGTALCRRYGADGATVVVGDIDPAAARAVADAIEADGGRAFPLEIDMTDDAGVAAFIAAAERRTGGLDGVHVNAAMIVREDVDVVDIDLALFDRLLSTNAGGHMRCARHAVPALLRRGGGSILFTSSGAAYAADPVRVGYAMAKSAIHALSRHIARRWGAEGIRANVLAPGVVMHEALERNAPTLRAWAMKRVAGTRLGNVDDIAAMAALIMSDEGGYITGQVISIDGGSTMRP